ncbi:MAG: DegV family protein, partial [Thermodesulfobacteriota bacterium]|nr:DegV family protein [Thermodesulfobacteriota bacterium]
NQKEQIEFAFSRLEQSFDKDSCPLIMLQYSDNRTWVADTVEKEIKKRYPLADVILQPLSLTSGAHMGPGTWAVAFLPEIV